MKQRGVKPSEKRKEMLPDPLCSNLLSCGCIKRGNGSSGQRSCGPNREGSSSSSSRGVLSSPKTKRTLS